MTDIARQQKAAATRKANAERRAAALEAPITAKVEAILANERVPEETRLKLAYCQRELARRDDASLRQRRKELMRESER